jgi:hypothetical protein
MEHENSSKLMTLRFEAFASGPVAKAVEQLERKL